MTIPESSLEFMAAVAALTLIAMFHTFFDWKTKTWTNPIKYLKARPNIAYGIKFAGVFALVALVLGSLSGCTGKYMNYADAYVGLDIPNGTSPQCRDRGDIDDKTTSNLGLVGNVYESADTHFKTNLKYTHHSCAFNSDIRVYDAIGVELKYRIYTR